MGQAISEPKTAAFRSRAWLAPLGSTALCSLLVAFAGPPARAADDSAIPTNVLNRGANGTARGSWESTAGDGAQGGTVTFANQPLATQATRPSNGIWNYGFAYSADGGWGGVDQRSLGSDGRDFNIGKFGIFNVKVPTGVAKGVVGGSGGAGGTVDLSTTGRTVAITKDNVTRGVFASLLGLTALGGGGGSTVDFGKAGNGGRGGSVSLTGALNLEIDNALLANTQGRMINGAIDRIVMLDAKGGWGGDAGQGGRMSYWTYGTLTRLGDGGNGGVAKVDLKTQTTLNARITAIEVDTSGGGGGAAKAGVSNALPGNGGGGGTIDVKFSGKTLSQSAGIRLLANGGDGSNASGQDATALGYMLKDSRDAQNVPRAAIGSGGKGGRGGTIDATIDDASVIENLTGPAVVAAANGGAGGVAAANAAGGAGGDGGSVNLRVGGKIISAGGGILAQSLGGVGGAGASDESFLYAKGDPGQAGGAGGTVNVSSTAEITVKGDQTYGIRALSGGGRSGTGGSAKALVLGWAKGGEGAPGQPGGAVSVVNAGKIAVSGNLAIGVFGESLGGGGGVGGASTSVAPTLQIGSIKIDLPVSPINIAIGGGGGGGGDGGLVTGVNSGTITTNGGLAHGLFVQSVGGGGGVGGFAKSVASVVVDPTGTIPALSVAIALGGTGGGGGKGGAVIAENLGVIQTQGMFSDAIRAQSVGGGGGSGGKVEAKATTTSFNYLSTTPNKVSISAALGLGGEGGGGGAGGDVRVANTGPSADIATVGALSNGVFAQSVGGGGGAGGEALTETKSDDADKFNLAVTVSLGGKGGGGGGGGAVEVRNSGSIVAMGTSSNAIFAQSVGGGGGLGGTAKGESDAGGGTNLELSRKGLATSVDSLAITSTITIGGKGGDGGNGGTVAVVNSDGGSLLTLGDFGRGVFAQSVGGGGGAGGDSQITPGGGTFKVPVALGGSGGKGGVGGAVSVSNINAFVVTTGGMAAAVEAQSVGGGGGSGGKAIKGPAAASNPIADIATSETKWAKAGAKKGISGLLIGEDADKNKIFKDIRQTSKKDLAAALGNVLLGQVTKVVENYSPVKTSLSLAFKDGQFAPKLSASIELQAGVTLGGTGGAGGGGGTVSVFNDADSLFLTLGDGSHAVVAQSVGGGGGDGGAVLGKGAGGTFGYDLTIGGSGSAGGDGGMVKVENRGLILTAGTYADGVLAQSVGRGGGNFGGAMTTEDVTARGLTAGSSLPTSWTASVSQVSYMKVAVGGGVDGGAGKGGEVTVSNTGGVFTLGDTSHGIHAQSVGGGGGTATLVTPGLYATTGWTVQKPNPAGVLSEISLGGSAKPITLLSGRDRTNAKNASAGGAVTVTDAGTIETLGYASNGILAQSVGGGGGQLVASLQMSADLPISLGGAGFGDGGSVTVNKAAGKILTAGNGAHGILAQSVGGGGGYMVLGGAADAPGRNRSVMIRNNLTPRGWSRSQFANTVIGDGGEVNVSVLNGAGIETSGRNAFGILAQSVGAGGGILDGGNDNFVVTPFPRGTYPGYNSGRGGNVAVTVDGSIKTTGYGAVGVFAQSVGAGGGLILGGRSVASNLAAYVADNNGFYGRSRDAETIGLGGAVRVGVSGWVITTGDEAPGVMAVRNNNYGVVGANLAINYRSATSYSRSYDATNFKTDGSNPVEVSISGVVSATGKNSPGVFAFSGFGNGTLGTQARVNVSGFVSGGTGDQGYGVYVVSSGAAKVTVEGTGSVGSQSGKAIFAMTQRAPRTDQQTVYVENNGMIIGDIVLQGQSPYLVNNGVISGASKIDVSDNSIYYKTKAGYNGKVYLYDYNVRYSPGKFQNNGILILNNDRPETVVTANFQQTATGKIEVAAQKLGANTPLTRLRITGPSSGNWVTGQANLDGTLYVNTAQTKQLDHSWITVLSAAGGITGQIKLDDSAVAFTFEQQRITTADGPSLQIRAVARTAQVVTTGRMAGVAASLDSVFNASTTLAPEIQSLYGAMSEARSGGQADTLLEELTTDPSETAAAEAPAKGGEFVSRMLSCPTFQGKTTELREEDCLWVRFLDGRTRQDQSDTLSGYRSTNVGWQLGGQKQVMPDWFLALSAGYDQSRTSAQSAPAFTTGETVNFGAGMKWQPGSWLFAGAVDYAHGSFNTQRALNLPDYSARVTSGHDMQSVTGRVRGAYQFAFEGWYLKPQLDFDLSYVRTPAYEETGAGALNLRVDAHDQVFFATAPAFEVGKRFDLTDEWLLRAYATFGMVAKFGGQWTSTARLAGADSSQPGFKVSGATPNQLGTLNAGLELYSSSGLEIRGEYAFRGAPGFQSHTGALRMAQRF